MASSTVSTHYHFTSPSPSSKNNANIKLSSSLFVSPISLSSNSNISLQFFGKKHSPLLSTAPRRLSVIAMAPPKPGGKAKKVIGLIKLALEAGKATPAPPVGPALGSKGVNIMAFCKDYNARTADKAGYVIPVEITVYDDKSFTFVLKTPPASVLLLKAAGVEKGSKDPKMEKVGMVTIDQLRAIATEKLPDLNCTTIESAMRIIAGTAANMGIDVDPPILEPKTKDDDQTLLELALEAHFAVSMSQMLVDEYPTEVGLSSVMEVRNSEHGRIIDMHVDVPAVKTSLGGSRICAGATCGFSDAKTSSKDAKERGASMKKLGWAVVLCLIFMAVEILIWLLAGILVYEAIARLIYDTGEVQGALMFAVSAVGLLVNVVMALLLGHDHGHGHGGHGHGRSDHDQSHEDHDHTHTNRLSGATHHNHHHHEGNSEDNDEHHATHGADLAEPLLRSHTEVENKTKGGDEQKKQRNINMQGAYLHVLGDSIQSLGVMLGGAIIWYKPGWKIIDLICTLVFSIIVLGTTISMLRNILEVLMESTPREIDATTLEKGLCGMDAVVSVHELHIWAITVEKFLLACHVMIKPDDDADMVLDKVIDYIRTEHNISHVTIQIERQ
ncbi:hypothetical protein NC651_027559 [Populus alba x Populus x berolinensis]|nr:hypothetical protein NC651_027559 [Populus alba x Populus x berolinensis]